MGRKSALTPEQWAIVEHRHIAGGESLCSLAKEFGVNESSLRRKISAKANAEPGVRESLHELAARKVKADSELKEVNQEIDALPAMRKLIVNDIVQELSAVTGHILSSARYMSATSHRLSGIANTLMDKVDDVEPEKSLEVLQKAAVLIRMSNDASHIPLNLLKANQEAINAMSKPKEEAIPDSLEHFYGK